MDFILRTDARKWFEPLRGSLVAPTGASQAWHFDAFYFCFIAGIASGTKAPSLPSGDDRIPVVEHFPGPYRTRGRLVVSVFLAHELASLGVEMDDKQMVREAVARLVNPHSANYLTDYGVQELSKYAAGGFDVLLEWFDHQPRSLHSFLQMFKEFVDESIEEGAIGGSGTRE